MRTLIAVVALLFATAAHADPRFAIAMNDGSVEIMQVVQGTPEEAIAKWTPDHSAKVVSITPIDTADIPAERTFRNQWKFDGVSKKVVVDMAKARVFWKEKVTQAVADAAGKLDNEARRADAVGDNAARAAAESKKANLRGIVPTQAIEAAQTPEELKAAWPAVLGAP